MNIIVLGNLSLNKLNYYAWKDAIDGEYINYVKDFSGTDVIPNDTDIVIISYATLIVTTKEYLLDLKKKEIKIVLYLFDSLDILYGDCKKRILDYYSQQIIDDIFSYDIMDCRSYNFIYHEQIYSPQDINRNDLNIIYDAYFAGRNKERINILQDIITEMQLNNLECLVRMPDMPIEYNGFFSDVLKCNLKSKILSYNFTVLEMLKCSCILDIVQDGQSGISWRVIEAICYNKKLLTNNKTVLSNRYYNPMYIQYFDDVKSIDMNWVKENVVVNYNYKGDYSPLSLIQAIINRHLECRNK